MIGMASRENINFRDEVSEKNTGSLKKVSGIAGSSVIAGSVIAGSPVVLIY
jgi:hypothetical protein